MARIDQLETDHKEDQDAFQGQEKLKKLDESLQQNPMLSGVLLDLEFNASNSQKPLVQRINHGLTRIPIGWHPVSVKPKNASAQLQEFAGTNEKRLHLFATDDCTAKVWVF